MLAKALQQASGGVEKLYVDDVFSTWLYDGNGSTQAINNGIDLAGKGGMVWLKERSSTGVHVLTDTVRAAPNYLSTNSTNPQGAGANLLTSFTSSGFSLGSGGNANASGSIYTSWTFRNAPKFFTHTTVSHTNGTPTNVDLSSLGTVGMVVVKRTDSTSDWIVAHRSIPAPDNLKLNTTGTPIAAGVVISGTNAVISSTVATGTYVVYAWAHDTASDGMVQCGLGSGVSQITLGWEPQFILAKRIDSTSNWTIEDSLLGLDANTASNPALLANTTAAESTTNGSSTAIDATGFTGPTASWTSYIYLAIRIPNKPPTSGTQVFQPTVYTGTNVDNRLVNTGIKTDMAWFRMRSGSGAGYEGFVVGDRLRGQGWLKTGATQAETTTADGLDQQIVSTTEYGTAFSSMNGVWVGNNTGAAASNTNINANTTAINHIAYAFQRRPGFFDIVCYTGTGVARTVPHQLGVAPELMIIGCRSSAQSYPVYFGDNTSALLLNSSAAKTASSSSPWNNTNPTSSVFSIGAWSVHNAGFATHVAYLFATLPGISKVGIYTSNGSSQTIDCGFTTGARFVLIKRTDNTGNWAVMDTARGITSSNDPVLWTNLTNSENNLSNSINPDSVGFQLALNNPNTNLNVSGATYIYLAIA